MRSFVRGPEPKVTLFSDANLGTDISQEEIIKDQQLTRRSVTKAIAGTGLFLLTAGSAGAVLSNREKNNITEESNIATTANESRIADLDTIFIAGAAGAVAGLTLISIAGKLNQEHTYEKVEEFADKAATALERVILQAPTITPTSN